MKGWASKTDQQPSPHRRERDLAKAALDDGLELCDVDGLLARYREELLAPFVELQRDFKALGDMRVAATLQELIDTARGVP